MDAEVVLGPEIERVGATQWTPAILRAAMDLVFEEANSRHNERSI
jgi:hypothetical protein